MTQQEVLEKHPDIFCGFFEGTKETTCMFWGLETPEEWYPVIDELCTVWESFRDSRGKKPQLIADQVKEKFGGFRFYYHFEGGSPDRLDFYTNLFDAMLFYAEHRILQLERQKILEEKELEELMEQTLKEIENGYLT